MAPPPDAPPLDKSASPDDVPPERHPRCVCGCRHSVHQEPLLDGCMNCKCPEYRSVTSKVR